MYFGSRYTSTQVVSGVRQFACRRCGHTEPAFVIGVGTGQGVSPFFLDRSGAAQRATEEARGDALRHLDVTLGLCPCPKCGTRNAGTGFALKCLFLVAFVAALGPVVGAASGAMRGKLGWLFWPLGLVLAVVVYFSGFHATWARARERVRFGLSRAELARLGSNAGDEGADDAEGEKPTSDDGGLDAPPRPSRGRFDGLDARTRLRAQARERVRRAVEQGPASQSSFDETGATGMSAEPSPNGLAEREGGSPRRAADDACAPGAAAKRPMRREELRKRARERARGARGERTARGDDAAQGTPPAPGDEQAEHEEHDEPA